MAKTLFNVEVGFRVEICLNLALMFGAVSLILSLFSYFNARISVSPPAVDSPIALRDYADDKRDYADDKNWLHVWATNVMNQMQARMRADPRGLRLIDALYASL
jgi:hypothetical protein